MLRCVQGLLIKVKIWGLIASHELGDDGRKIWPVRCLIKCLKEGKMLKVGQNADLNMLRNNALKLMKEF